MPEPTYAQIKALLADIEAEKLYLVCHMDTVDRLRDILDKLPGGSLVTLVVSPVVARNLVIVLNPEPGDALPGFTEQEIRDVEVELFRSGVLNKIPSRATAIAVLSERAKEQDHA